MVGAERMFEILDTKPEVVEKPSATPLSNIEGKVVFDGVSFAYKEGKTMLDKIHFTTELGPGDRQLLGTARAILADPRILILDEATSSEEDFESVEYAEK